MSRAPIMLAAILAFAPASRQTAPSASPDFTLFFLSHAIGREDVVRTADDAGTHLRSTFHFDDRGAAIDLTGALDLAPDGAATRLTVTGKTYRYFSSEVDVRVANGRALVREGAATSTVDVGGRPFFPLDSYAPIAVHEALIQYWMAHGRPAEILAAPAGPVRITRRASRRLVLGQAGATGATVEVERLAIEGAVWGTETAWVVVPAERHLAGRLVALVTWAGALPFEAAHPAAVRHLAELRAEAIGDRIDDLRELTRRTPPEHASTFALVGGTVITGADQPAIDDAVVVIRDGRIEAVGPRDRTPLPRGVAVVDARGQFLLPGLWDMHAHASQVDWAPVYLAGGVTTIRDMGGEADFLTAFRDVIRSGRALGPDVLLAGLVDGSGPRAFGDVYADTPAEGREVVRRYKRWGFDEIKIYSLVTPPVVRAIADEARAQGMLVTGHVPNGMTAREAVEAGFNHIAHMPLRGGVDDAATRADIRFFADHETTIDPVASWGEYLGRAAETPIESFQPGFLRLPAPLQRMIGHADVRSGDPAAIKNRQLQSLRLLKAAHDGGVPIVAGTDKGIPGFSVQREIELYVEGGMTPLEAIQAATIVPARVMRLERDRGAIAVGQRADLVILGSDPLADIRNIRDARAVVAAGRLYDAAALWRAAGYRQP